MILRTDSPGLVEQFVNGTRFSRQGTGAGAATRYGFLCGVGAYRRGGVMVVRIGTWNLEKLFKRPASSRGRRPRQGDGQDDAIQAMGRPSLHGGRFASPW